MAARLAQLRVEIDAVFKCTVATIISSDRGATRRRNCGDEGVEGRDKTGGVDHAATAAARLRIAGAPADEHDLAHGSVGRIAGRALP